VTDVCLQFVQQQDKITKAAIQLGNLAESKEKQTRELRRAAMTAKEVDGMSESVCIYKQCGRM